MIQQDLQNLVGLRGDGRKSGELRNITCKTGINPNADGSSYFRIGLTEVVCMLYGPKELNATEKKLEKSNLINVEYSVAPFSGAERRKVSKFDKDWSEFSENLRISFESLICVESYPKCEINLLISVIQADGSTKSAIFNAICLALLDAGITMKDFMVSCTSGFVNNHPVIDLTYQEQSSCNGELIISYTPKKDKISFMELKSSKTTQQDFVKLMEINVEACKTVYAALRQYIVKASLQKYICSK